MSNDVKTKRVWRARATGKTYPAPPWDRETEHLKNVAKKKGLGTYKVNSPEQRVAIKQSCAEFDRANRITREEFMDKVREVLTAEYKWNGRVRITKDGIQDIVRKHTSLGNNVLFMFANINNSKKTRRRATDLAGI